MQRLLTRFQFTEFVFTHAARPPRTSVRPPPLRLRSLLFLRRSPPSLRAGAPLLRVLCSRLPQFGNSGSPPPDRRSALCRCFTFAGLGFSSSARLCTPAKPSHCLELGITTAVNIPSQGILVHLCVGSSSKGSELLLLLDMSLSPCIGSDWIFWPKFTSKACISQGSFRVASQKQEHREQCEILEFDNKIENVVPNYSPKVKGCSRLPPLVSALKTSAKENAASFHFPGHNRGHAAPTSLIQLIGTRPFMHDLPELPELDNLFAPEGPILEAQKQAAEVFGAKETWFLVGGSTCGVQAAIMAACLPGDTLILPRNCHISAISAMVLSGVIPKYIIPEYDPEWDIAGGITPAQVQEAINDLEGQGLKPAAVLVVSPSYHGICSDISAISNLCHSYNIPIIVDEAHGAHFGFHGQLPPSALSQGADLVVQSTHKVLSSLTQSSMLHFSSNLVDRDRISKCLQMLQSSSPSYLLLASLDAATTQLHDNGGVAFHEAIELALEAKSMINKIPGIALLDGSIFPKFPTIDPLRVTVGVHCLGISGFEADDILCRDFGVVCELVGTKSITLAFNLGTQRDHISRLVMGLKSLSTTFSHTTGSVPSAVNLADLSALNDIVVILSPRDAFFARKRKVVIKESVGKVCGELICAYQPGIPLMAPGEVATRKVLECLVQLKSKGATIIGVADDLLSSLLVCET